MKNIFTMLAVLLFSSHAYASKYKVRCDKAQKRCEILTKRMVVGDRVGIFNDSGYLLAIGKVNKLSGRKRVIEITKKFALIRRGDKAELLSDSEAAQPKKYFKVYRLAAAEGFALSLELLSIGAGSGLSGFSFGGMREWQWKPGIYFLGRGGFSSASGDASYQDEDLKNTSISLQSISGLAGFSFWLGQGRALSFRSELSGGFVQASLKTGDGSDPKKTTVGRLSPGLGLHLLATGEVVTSMSGYSIFFGPSIMRFQNTFSYSVKGGLYYSL